MRGQTDVDRLDWCDPVGVIRQLIDAGAACDEIARALGCTDKHVRSMLAGKATYITIAGLPRLRGLARLHLVPAWPWPTLASVTQQRLDELRDARIDWMRSRPAGALSTTPVERRARPVFPQPHPIRVGSVAPATSPRPSFWRRLFARSSTNG